MKQKFESIVLLLLACAFCTRLTAQEYGGHVTFSGTPNVGVITVLSDGFGKNVKQSNADARAGALYALLFRGIPGSSYELPMVPHEEEKKNDPTITALLKGGYDAFIMADQIQGETKTTKKKDGQKGIIITHQITINCEALRRYLEERSVIRKFGY